MYALVALLAMIALTCWLQAFTTDADAVRRGAGDRLRRRPRGDALHAQLGATSSARRPGSRGCGCCGAPSRPSAARLLRTGLRRLRRRDPALPPWIPTALYQAAHTGRAVVAVRRRSPTLASVPARHPRRRRRGRGPARRRRGRRRAAAHARAALRATRRAARDRGADDRPRLARRRRSRRPGRRATSRPACPPFVLLGAAGFAHAGRLGLVGLALVAVLWAIDGAPAEKSNVRDVAEAIAPSLHPGDLVVATQPEQVSGARLLPARTGCATRR